MDQEGQEGSAGSDLFEGSGKTIEDAIRDAHRAASAGGLHTRTQVDRIIHETGGVVGADEFHVRVRLIR